MRIILLLLTCASVFGQAQYLERRTNCGCGGDGLYLIIPTTAQTWTLMGSSDGTNWTPFISKHFPSAMEKNLEIRLNTNDQMQIWKLTNLITTGYSPGYALERALKIPPMPPVATLPHPIPPGVPPDTEPIPKIPTPPSTPPDVVAELTDIRDQLHHLFQQQERMNSNWVTQASQWHGTMRDMARSSTRPSNVEERISRLMDEVYQLRKETQQK